MSLLDLAAVAPNLVDDLRLGLPVEASMVLDKDRPAATAAATTTASLLLLLLLLLLLALLLLEECRERLLEGGQTVRVGVEEEDHGDALLHGSPVLDLDVDRVKGGWVEDRDDALAAPDLTLEACFLVLCCLDPTRERRAGPRIEARLF